MEESNYSDDFEDIVRPASHKKAKHTSAKKKACIHLDRNETGKKCKSNEWNQERKCSTYYWSDIQNKRYIKFLKECGDLLLLPPNERKIKKVNLLMSKKIKSRNSTQCHTHHQKMMGKHASIEGIIYHYESLFEGKRKLEIDDSTSLKMQVQEPQEVQVQQQAPKIQIPVLEDIAIVEHTFISLENIIVDEGSINGYYEYQEKELLEWIDW